MKTFTLFTLVVGMVTAMSRDEMLCVDKLEDRTENPAGKAVFDLSGHMLLTVQDLQKAVAYVSDEGKKAQLERIGDELFYLGSQINGIAGGDMLIYSKPMGTCLNSTV
ncbi:hypothetical protein VB005_00249 [Metarhizium brunneum]